MNTNRYRARFVNVLHIQILDRKKIVLEILSFEVFID